MKTIRIFLPLIVAGLTGLAIAGPSSDKDKVAALYARLDSLTVKKDVAGITKFLKDVTTKDCVFIDASGKKETTSSMTAKLGPEMAGIDKVENSSQQIVKFTMKGATAVAIISQKYSLTSKANSTVPQHKISVVSTSEDTWVKVNGVWKLKISKTTKEDATMDGKPIKGS